MAGTRGGSALVSYVQDGAERKMSSTFFRGDVINYFPTAISYLSPSVVSDYLVKGWMPDAPFIDKDARIVTFGSCFASNIAKFLNKIGYDVPTKRDQTAYISRMGDGIVNTYALRQQFEWAWLNKKPRVALWHGYDATEFGYDEAVRVRTAEMFDEADVFILTLGLSEIWYDEPTGEVFWRAVPADRYDPARHKFRVATHHENLVNLLEMYKLIRQRKPDAAIVFTLSPIPLAATFRPIGCVAANAVSKAILRAALDEFLQAAQPRDPKLFYFPSYEIVLYPFNNQFLADQRHVYKHILDFNMKVFERYFCMSGRTDADVARSFRAALIRDQSLSDRLAAIARLKGAPEERQTRKLAVRKFKRLAERVEQRRETVKRQRRRAKIAGAAESAAPATRSVS